MTAEAAAAPPTVPSTREFDPPQRSPEGNPVSKLTALLTLVATGLTFVGGTFVYIGQFVHPKWMDHWGVDAQQIPADVRQLALLGFSAVFDGTSAIMLSVSLPLVGQLIALLSVCWWIWASLSNKQLQERNEARFNQVIQKVRPAWLRRAGAAIGISSAFVLWLYCLLFSAVMALFVGPAAGSGFAERWALRQTEKFEKGCKSDKGRPTCTEMLKDGHLLAKGFILTSSADQVLIYDVSLKRPRLIGTKDAEFIGWAM